MSLEDKFACQLSLAPLAATPPFIQSVIELLVSNYGATPKYEAREKLVFKTFGPMNIEWYEWTSRTRDGMYTRFSILEDGDKWCFFVDIEVPNLRGAADPRDVSVTVYLAHDHRKNAAPPKIRIHCTCSFCSLEEWDAFLSGDMRVYNNMVKAYFGK